MMGVHRLWLPRAGGAAWAVQYRVLPREGDSRAAPALPRPAPAQSPAALRAKAAPQTIQPPLPEHPDGSRRPLPGNTETSRRCSSVGMQAKP